MRDSKQIKEEEGWWVMAVESMAESTSAVRQLLFHHTTRNADSPEREALNCLLPRPYERFYSWWWKYWSWLPSVTDSGYRVLAFRRPWWNLLSTFTSPLCPAGRPPALPLSTVAHGSPSARQFILEEAREFISLGFSLSALGSIFRALSFVTAVIQVAVSLMLTIMASWVASYY